MNIQIFSKKLFLLIALLTPSILFGQDRILQNSEIPSEIQNYIKSHFPSQSIMEAKSDKDGASLEYDIKLSDKTELDFNSKFEVTKIDGKTALPQSVIPQSIFTYIKTAYPNNAITDWEKKRNRQEIELDNGVELDFTSDGKFIKVDK